MSHWGQVQMRHQVNVVIRRDKNELQRLSGFDISRRKGHIIL